MCVVHENILDNNSVANMLSKIVEFFSLNKVNQKTIGLRDEQFKQT